MAASLAVLCIFLFLGVAAQSVGLYVFAIALPAWFALSKRSVPADMAKISSTLGLLFLGLWVLFPLANVVAFFSEVPSLAASSYFREWPQNRAAPLSSRLSSAWLASGVSLLVVGVLIRARVARSVTVDDMHLQESPQGFRVFLRALVAGTLVWTLALCVQHFTGMSFHAKSAALLPEHQMSNGLFRVFGFYGHPLSVAGVGLALFSFLWFLTWGFAEAHTPLDGGRVQPSPLRNPLALFPKSPPWVSFLALAAASVAAFLAVVMSGGRTALGVAVLVALVLPFSVRLTGAAKKLRYAGVLLTGFAFFGLVFSSGIASRIAAAIQNASSGVAENRVHFWEVYLRMIADAPALGHGHYWIEKGLRETYYNALGFGSLEEKFNAHNIYLEVFANIGAVGAGLALFFVVMLVRTLRQLSVQAVTHGPRLFFRGLRAAIVANFLHALTQNVFFDSNVLLPYLALFWALFWFGATQAPFAGGAEGDLSKASPSQY
ncbi:MAG: O-antigen ligase family protein [Silvanigrellales bacterium]|jgi:O-antigen ligase|nr:O-antigen ligase family protein [Silvanigrellales bacterium]